MSVNIYSGYPQLAFNSSRPIDSLLFWTTLCVYMIYLQHTINMTDPHQDNIILFVSCG